MRTRLALAALGAIVVVASQAGAAPKPRPQLTDAKGDYPVASADIVSATLSSVPHGTAALLRIDLTLAAPLTVVPYSYTFGFTVPGCHFRVVYFGHPFKGFIQKSTVGCLIANKAMPEANYRIEGSTITFIVPMSGALKRGARATDLFAVTEPSALTSASKVAMFGDTATGTDWVLGSDQPKKKK